MTKDLFNPNIVPRLKEQPFCYFQKTETLNMMTQHHVFLHMSGKTFTSDFKLIWKGTIEQANNIKFKNKSQCKLIMKGYKNARR